MPSGPKSTKYTNRHANEANARKADAAASAKATKVQQAEDEYWRDDDDKQGAKKAARAAEKDEKDRLARERKAERQAELEEEEKAMEKKPPKAVTKKEQQRLMASLARDYDMEKNLKNQSSDDGDLKSRHNKAVTDTKRAREDHFQENRPKRAEDGSTSTTTGGGKKGGIDNAMDKDSIDDRHVGKRARVAYRKFEEANLDSVKKSKPGLRRTQYNDLLWTMWQKSPENPFVQRQVRRANEMLERKWCQADEEPSDDEGMVDDE